jgi:hypothetical protein
MAASHGSKAIFKLGTNGVPQTASDLSIYANSVGITLNRDSSEVSTFGVTSKKYIPGLKDATVPFEGPYDTVSDLHLWDLLNNGTIVLFEYYPSGSTTGLPKFSGQCFITSYEVSSDIGDANAVSAEFQVTGDVARALVP